VPVLPEQAVWVDEVVADRAEAGCVMVVAAVVLHPPAELTVTVYVAADNPVAVALVCPPGAQL
jgi:hypothetical protein